MTELNEGELFRSESVHNTRVRKYSEKLACDYGDLNCNGLEITQKFTIMSNNTFQFWRKQIHQITMISF